MLFVCYYNLKYVFICSGVRIFLSHICRQIKDMLLGLVLCFFVFVLFFSASWFTKYTLVVRYLRFGDFKFNLK